MDRDRARARRAAGAGGDADLDFKREPHTKSEEIAKDVAAFANAGGGVLVLGVQDQGNRAHRLSPFAVDDALEQRLRGSVADLGAPVPLGLALRWLGSPSTPGSGYLLVLVPRSADAPHAVRGTGGSPKLGYPTRDGDHTRWLAEAEVAARYRSRFALQAERRDRLAELQQQGWDALLTADRLWLSLTLVPDQPGQATTGQIGVQHVQELLAATVLFPSPLRLDDMTARVGLRRVTVSGRLEEAVRRADLGHAELHADGSGFAAVEASPGGLRPGTLRGEPVNIVGILLRHLEAAMAAALQLLVQHATGRGRCTGDATVAVRLHAGGDNGMWQLTVTELRPATGEPQRLAGATHRREPAAFDAVVALDAAAGSSRELLVTSHLLTLDLLSVFGVAPALAIRPDGSLRSTWFGPDQAAVRSWAAAHDVAEAPLS